jgi:oligopeptide transport system ATP-binding protein
MALLEVKDLTVRFETHRGDLRAVDGVSFQLEEGRTLGLVGESGSGKSVTALALMGLVPTPPGRIERGEVRYGGRDLLRLSKSELRKLRGKEIALIFQDPITSLNPLLSIERQLSEVLEVHLELGRREVRKRIIAALDDVGIPSPEARLSSFPHQLSGGMCQRVMIAMALLCAPRILIADEPTTALDVTIQAQILELLRDLQRTHGTAILLITHDLGVAAGMCDSLEVMYAGRLVEGARAGELFETPLHPYTKGLLASVPRLTGDVGTSLSSIPGRAPDLPTKCGCAFAPRCEDAVERCQRETPPEIECGTGRRIACFRPGGEE